MFSPAFFFSSLKLSLGSLTQSQVDGFNNLLGEAALRITPTNHLANILATTWWESGKTMQPVKEAFYLGDKAEAWRKKNLRYWPYYGRGYVQLTWEYNYKKATEYFKSKGIDVDFVKNPDDVMKTEYALDILFEGMKAGWFTTKKLSDYIDDVDESDEEDLREFVAARRIINGTDKAETIGKIALNFEHALRYAKWDEGVIVQEPSRLPTLPPATSPPAPQRPTPIAPKGLIQAIIDFLVIIFGKKGK